MAKPPWTGLEVLARRWLAGDCPGGHDITVTNGAVDAVERLLGAYLAAGDKVAVEDPCFVSSINTLRIAGLHAVGVAVDAEGMQAEALERALAQGAQAVIVTPRAHNPTGCSLSAARADQLPRCWPPTRTCWSSSMTIFRCCPPPATRT